MIGVGADLSPTKTQLVSSDDASCPSMKKRDGKFCRISEPLVNIEATFASAVQVGIIDQACSDHLMQVSQELYYKDRNFSRIFQHAEQSGFSYKNRSAEHILQAELSGSSKRGCSHAA